MINDWVYLREKRERKIEGDRREMFYRGRRDISFKPGLTRDQIHLQIQFNRKELKDAIRVKITIYISKHLDSNFLEIS